MWIGKRAYDAFRGRPLRSLLRAVMWAGHCLLRLSARPRFRQGFRLFLPPLWQGGGAAGPYIFRERYEPELALLDRFLSPGMVVVDGGAGMGIYTFAAASLVGAEGRVLAFEPGRTAFSALARSRELDDWPQVTLRRAALWHRVGRARLYHVDGRADSFSLGAPPDPSVSSEEVETTTIARALEEGGLDRLDLVKLDVEGAEEMALRGGLDVVAACRPVVIFEVNPRACANLGLEADGSMRLLAGLGYRFYRADWEGNLAPITAPLLHTCNYVALPFTISNI